MTEFAKILLVAIFFSPVFALATDDVGDSLRMDLHRLTKETHRQTVSYNNARKFIIGYLHTEPSTNGNYYVIRDVYCQDEHMTRGPREGASGMNVEHTWPQSHFFGGATQLRMKSDRHHLFPTKNQRARPNAPLCRRTGRAASRCPRICRGKPLSTGHSPAPARSAAAHSRP